MLRICTFQLLTTLISRENCKVLSRLNFCLRFKDYLTAWTKFLVELELDSPLHHVSAWIYGPPPAFLIFETQKITNFNVLFIYERFCDDFFKYSDKNVVSPQNNSQRHKKSAGNLIDQKAEVSWPISVVLCALNIADDVSSYEYHKHLTSNFSLVIIYRLLDTYCHFLAFPYLSQKSNFIICIKKYSQQFHEYSRNLSHNRESQSELISATQVVNK